MSRRATFRNGRVELSKPADWLEGCELDVSPVGESLGISEEDWPKTPEEIEEWIRQCDLIEPLNQTDEELKAWEEALRVQKAYDIANAYKRVDGLFP